MAGSEKTRKKRFHNDSLEGWDGGLGREVQEGGDIYIPMADSHCCMAETNTTF